MPYPSNLSATQWDLIKSYFDTGDYGKKHKRAPTNEVFYLIEIENSLSLPLLTIHLNPEFAS
ncbi:hypothetical protein K737_300272 [Holospora undulata HU1]|uniref:Uncharacterized protein n=1 Tax=Holospora undulata HU1 TaxID=1321371 RepID=A0A061JGP3_9PROT|nr:hypothetical protein K737_300272 [Holospora undulata HU1]